MAKIDPTSFGSELFTILSRRLELGQSSKGERRKGKNELAYCGKLILGTSVGGFINFEMAHKTGVLAGGVCK